MIKRLSAFLLVCCMLLSCMWSAQASGLIDRREMYPKAMQQLRDYLGGYPVDGPDDLVNKFTLCGDIGESYCFLQYSLCLQGIEANDFGLVFYKIDELRMLPDFCAYLEEEGFASLDELENYALGRQAEAEGRIEDAIAFYDQTSIINSRRLRMQLRDKRNQTQYQQAMAYYNAGTYADAERAAGLFDSLGSYKDSEAMADKARQAMDRLRYIRATDTGSGTSRSIRVEASGSWTASANVSWISLSRKSGSGNATVTVTLQKNKSTVSSRTGTITFTCGNRSDTVTITQPRADSITAKLSGDGNTRTIQVTANGNWTVAENASWITLDKISGSGDAVIRATLTKNPSATSSRECTLVFTCGSAEDTLKITQKPATVAVTGVELDKDSAEVKVGERLALIDTVLPSDATNKAVTWSSSNTSVATVRGGVVTGKAAGIATIAVRTADGSKTDSCKVAVYSKPQITFTDYSREAKADTAGVAFEAKVTGGKTPYKYSWTMYRSGTKVSSTNTLTTSSGKISWAYGAFSEAGSHQAKLSVTDALGQVVTAQTSIITVSRADSISVTACGTGDTRTLTVKASGSWTASANEDWVTLSKKSSSSTSTTVTATLKPNSGANRSAKVTFVCGSASETVTITQRKTQKTAQEYYKAAEQARIEGNMRDAFYSYLRAGEYQDARVKAMQAGDSCIAVGLNGVLFLKEDGTVAFAGSSNGKFDPDDFKTWRGIVAISSGGVDTYYGLKSNGRVVAIGDNWCGQCDVSGWTNIVAIDAGYDHVLGLKKDGTVVATGDTYDGKCQVGQWKNVVQIEAAFLSSVGLTSDGTLLYAGSGQDGLDQLKNWKMLKLVALGDYHAVIIRSNGQLKSFGDTSNKRNDIGGWTDVVHVVAGSTATVGLKRDGSIVYCGARLDEWLGNDQAKSWKNIAAVGLHDDYIYAVTTEGDILATHNFWSDEISAIDLLD